MKLLALDTSTHACSVALSLDGVMYEQYQEAPRQQGDLILPMISAVMAQANVSWDSIDALAFGCGPGAFTGLRIAAGVVQGLALAHDLPVYPVSCLQALAYRAHCESGKRYIAVAQDARMNEVYAAGFSIIDEVMTTVHEEQVIAPKNFRCDVTKKWHCVGTGFDQYAGQFTDLPLLSIDHAQSSMLPRAKEIAQLALLQHQQGVEGVPVEQVALRYLRNQVV
jgi:tRNA threonylcarbamoyladenosine biosynthesis protein TsaB